MPITILQIVMGIFFCVLHMPSAHGMYTRFISCLLTGISPKSLLNQAPDEKKMIEN